MAETVHTATSIHSMFTYFVTDYSNPLGFQVIIWFVAPFYPTTSLAKLCAGVLR